MLHLLPSGRAVETMASASAQPGTADIVLTYLLQPLFDIDEEEQDLA